MAAVVPFLSKEARERDALIKQARANYESVFPTEVAQSVERSISIYDRQMEVQILSEVPILPFVAN
jgi:hypothetical protein